MKKRHGPCFIGLSASLALAACGSEPDPHATASATAIPQTTTSAAAIAPLAAPAPSEVPPEPPPGEPADPPLARYAPRDDCASQPGWPNFRKALGAAIRARDAEALAALAAPDVALDYGGGSGIAELKLRLADPETDLWEEMAAILPLGCAMEGGLAALPWVFWHMPDTVDSYRAMLVLGDDTPLRDRPGGQAVTSVGWSIVTLDSSDLDASAPATRVTLEDGRKGWIATASLRSMLDYRLIAEQVDGKWRVTAFIAGD